MLSRKVNLNKLDKAEREHFSTYGTRYFSQAIPKFEMPQEGMPPEAAYQLIHDELNLDGNPSLNLASFVTTWMEPEADKLIRENIGKNFVDNDEYPQSELIQERVINMLARLFNAPEEIHSVGTSTIGSSEAIMLGLLAHKWNWRKQQEAQHNPSDPNIVMGADVHVVWEKFAKYFDVELRKIPMETDRFTLKTEKVEEEIDENTICVGTVLGTTFTGGMDPVKEINDLLVEIKKSDGWNIPIHVDAASGGFIVPFIYPELEWDFRLPQVKSINVSGHKYGLVYPGVGWLIFRDKEDLPEDLIFHVNYLGGLMPTYNLNFSKGSSTVIAQYYNLLRLGRDGYRRIMINMLQISRYLSKILQETGQFEILDPECPLPIITIKLKDPVKFTVFDLSSVLRERGWIVPAYTLPPNAEGTAVLRIVIKENFSRDMAEILVNHIKNAYQVLEKSESERKDISKKKEKISKIHQHKIC